MNRVQGIFTYPYISRGTIYENVITFNITVDDLFAVEEFKPLEYLATPPLDSIPSNHRISRQITEDTNAVVSPQTRKKNSIHTDNYSQFNNFYSKVFLLLQ